MLSTSFEFRKRIAENSKVLMKATLTLADGTVANLSGDDFMMGTAAFSDAVSSDGSFDVGAAVIGQFSVSLNNYDGRFDEYDFTGASIVPYIGVELGAGGVEWLLKGHYFVEQPDSYGNTIAIKAFDNMHRFEEPYANVTTSYPATLRTIVQAICSHCGVVLADAAFANSTYSVAKRPDDSALSCLDIISHVAQVSGNFARCDTGGRLLIEWYDTAAFEGEDWLDGDRFDDATPYASGDDADGGDFLDYTSGDSVDGGAFGLKRFATIHAISNSTIVTDDVVVTGVRVTAQDEVSQDGTQGNDGETYLYGSEGYVLDIGGNPLILYGRASAVAALIGPRVVGMRFRPFDLSAVGDPAIEAGDPAVVIDGHQNQYRTYLTSLTYKVGGYEAFSCSAETPSRNSATSYSALTKAIVKARNAVKRETTAREQAVDELARELAESSGLYMTRVEQPDHSYIYYMHDKPTLAESQIVWKLTANAFAISTDGGDTYPYGLDVTGNAILNRIYAIGLDASYIDTGRLVVGDAQDPMLLVDMDTGEVRINQLAYLAGRTVQSVLADVADAAKVATNYLNFSSSTGLDVGYAGTSAKTRVNGNGVEVFDGAGNSALYAGLSGSNSIVRVGKATGSGNVVMSSEGYVDVRNASTIMAHFGYGYGKNESGGTSMTPYYTLGTRAENSTIGNWSFTAGSSNTASNWCAVALGQKACASGRGAMAFGNGAKSFEYSWAEDGPIASGDSSLAFGLGLTKAAGNASLACGAAIPYGSSSSSIHTEANGYGSVAIGIGAKANGTAHAAFGYGTSTSWSTTTPEFACGMYNTSGYIFAVGCGDSSTRRNAFSVKATNSYFFSSSNQGTVYVNGTAVHSSDRRLKDHVDRLGDDAVEFVRALKPVRYRWKGGDGEHYGFYAQDVREADPHDTATVTEGEEDKALGFAPLSLDYNALVAPLVAYAQSLEERIGQLEERLAALEGTGK